MALSNIFREPRREITESVVGLALVGVFAWCDYRFACWLQDYTGLDSAGFHNIPWGFGMFVGVAGAIVIVFLVFATHALGEGICNSLQRGGIHLRPRNRR